MTQPTPHGYPDFGRYIARADKRYLSTGIVVTDNDIDYSLGFVGDVESLATSIFANVVGCSFTYTFYLNSDLTGRLTSYELTVAPAESLRTSLPVLGPYCVVTASPQGLGGSNQCNVWSGVRGAINTDTLAVSATIIRQNQVNIGAGITNTFAASRGWPGSAIWTVSSAAASARATLNSISAGVTQPFDSMLFTAPGTQSHRVFLPGTSIRATVQNTGAAAALFDCFLHCRSYEVGS